MIHRLFLHCCKYDYPQPMLHDLTLLGITVAANMTLSFWLISNGRGQVILQDVFIQHDRIICSHPLQKWSRITHSQKKLALDLFLRSWCCLLETRGCHAKNQIPYNSPMSVYLMVGLETDINVLVPKYPSELCRNICSALSIWRVKGMPQTATWMSDRCLWRPEGLVVDLVLKVLPIPKSRSEAKPWTLVILFWCCVTSGQKSCNN